MRLATLLMFSMLSFAGVAQATTLYGYGGAVAGELFLYAIDTDTLGVVELSPEPVVGGGPEIETDPGGETVFLSEFVGIDPNGLILLDAATGSQTGSLDLSGYPDDHNVVTSMAFLDDTLYATTTRIGPELDSDLVTIDTVSGAITPVGDTGLPTPVTGMVWDAASSTLYGITGTDDAINNFVSIDPATGLGTVLFALPDTDPDADPGGAWTGLALGRDGLYYAVANRGPNSLYRIDPASGDVTELGDLGVDIVSLATPIPEPGTGFLIAAGLVGMAAARRAEWRRPARARS